MKQTIAFLVIVITLILSAEAFATSEHIEYNIGLNEDGSALWTIIHVTDIDSPVQGWEEFEQRLLSTIEASRENTAREMTIDVGSLEMSTNIHWETSSKTTVYVFLWQNFSLIEQGQISFGDVFTAEFFSLLYGAGELYVTYPAGYILSSASFQPNQLDNSTQTMHWYRTQDFLVGAQITLLEARDTGFIDLSNLFAAAILGSGGLVIVVIGFFIFKRRRKQMRKLTKLDRSPSWQEAESDQEKILKLLQSSGGNLKQSEVCDKLQFSRAKTSLLLSEMEKNSLVRRFKKGKSKIVFRIEKKEGRNF
ncbi:MAG: hypothetical protein NWE80_01500 [Candidatus Bathyarchaeota archaeon]|nr:hypothetical protein [Candidatus Bathyarchaeota archaeon]